MVQGTPEVAATVVAPRALVLSYGIVSRTLFRQMSGNRRDLGDREGENRTKTVRLTGEAPTSPPKLYGAQSKFLI